MSGANGKSGTAKTDRKVFILGGGAVLGAHQVGALKYLEEVGIKPDGFAILLDRQLRMTGAFMNLR